MTRYPEQFGPSAHKTDDGWWQCPRCPKRFDSFQGLGGHASCHSHDDVAGLLPEAKAIARYYGRLVGYMRDEFESVAMVGLGEAALRFDPERGPTFERFARMTMHQRCRDAMRQWVRSRSDRGRGGTERAVPVAEWFEDTLPPVVEDDTEEWVWSCVTAALAEAREHAAPRGCKNPGRPSEYSFEVIDLWFSLGSSAAAAAALGIDPSRISQVMRQVADAIRPAVWEKLSA